ncbi:SsrA-binding protein [Mycoplasma sp. Ms02]|uniref:SsrA-binding protein n=1 Tax=Mycoplasma sp. Ms02 TaxID=353851 RepID=UPI001C890B23|nr:SsrA-binding protein [Mycoplasma sp. Ms02]QZE12183.1 SsrA-binding protein [Mycoplasma sp. Ms02]
MKIICDNKRDARNYEIIEKVECGMELQGWEVKSARANKISLNNSYCSIYKGEMFLKDAYFGQYMLVKADEYRDRKLLLHKREIQQLKFDSEAKQLTIIPLKMYFNKQSKIKLEIALARGLKKHDKRQAIIKREEDKKIRKIMQNY